MTKLQTEYISIEEGIKGVKFPTLKRVAKDFSEKNRLERLRFLQGSSDESLSVCWDDGSNGTFGCSEKNFNSYPLPNRHVLARHPVDYDWHNRIYSLSGTIRNTRVYLQAKIEYTQGKRKRGKPTESPKREVTRQDSNRGYWFLVPVRE